MSKEGEGHSSAASLPSDETILLFTNTLKDALDRQKTTIIEHFEERLKNSGSQKTTGVDVNDYVFKKEGNKIQHGFNAERIDKLTELESCLKLSKLEEALSLVIAEKEVFRKRNKILKIADKHGWDTVKEYLDSPLADSKEDAVELRAAIARASRNRNAKPYDRIRTDGPSSVQAASANKGRFNPRSFFRGFNQNSESTMQGGNQKFEDGAKCYYCNQPGHFARACPHRGSLQTAPASTITKDSAKDQ